MYGTSSHMSLAAPDNTLLDVSSSPSTPNVNNNDSPMTETVEESKSGIGCAISILQPSTSDKQSVSVRRVTRSATRRAAAAAKRVQSDSVQSVIVQQRRPLAVELSDTERLMSRWRLTLGQFAMVRYGVFLMYRGTNACSTMVTTSIVAMAAFICYWLASLTTPTSSAPSWPPREDMRRAVQHVETRALCAY